ncbi:putative GNAT family acetyltransferase [Cylindrobasidium torrendii FP15055 ss-10]|uniref:Putative GNAT family acetyltransferase n=1 Tax=Cylindrobasidium torrendii FP15055 ss-10 TaxID=1314674 RepID=A0A0D7BA45_9AGAR|nr:putative GNAT family acetyltransferase [Cylindrobasidium torrendii FP15055 ss-10]
MPDFTPDPAFRIETPRLVLGHLFADNPVHQQFIVDLYNTPEFHAAEGKTGIDTPEIAQKYINGRIKTLFEKFGYSHYAVYVKGDEEKPIGTVGLTSGDEEASFPGPDVGFVFLPEAMGKGYATEAASGLVAYAQKELGVKLIFGMTGEHNTRSQKVMERMGMEFRGKKKLKMFGGQESMVYVLKGMGELEELGIINGQHIVVD